MTGKSRVNLRFSAAILFLSLLSGQARAAFEVTGYAKSLDFGYPSTEDESAKSLSGNRLRLDGRWKDPKNILNLRLAADNEVLWGSLLKSQRTAVNSILAKEELLDMTWNLSENENFLWRENFYRAYAESHISHMDLTVGRQRIAWGQGRIWNPTDVINPYNPLSIERDERPGSDLADARWNFSALSFLEGVYAPKKDADWDKSIVMGKFRANVLRMDFEFVGGKRGKEDLAGFSQTAQVFDGSLRAEAIYNFDSEVRRDFAKAVISYDRSFSLPNTLYLLGEYFYNGIGEKNKEDYFKVVLNPQDQSFVGKDYYGFGATYDVTPLFKAECYGIINLNDGSFFAGPKMSWQPLTDLELSAGYQVYNGKDRTEFGNLRDIGFVQVQWFFSRMF